MIFFANWNIFQRSLRLLVALITVLIAAHSPLAFSSVNNASNELETQKESCFYVDPFYLIDTIDGACLIDSLFFFNPNAWNRSGARLLHLAILHDRVDLISVLLQMGADLYARDGEGRTARQLAIREGHQDAIFELERIERETQQLLIAIGEEEINHVAGAMERGAALWARDAWFYTPVLVAAEKGNIPAVELLLAAGASLRERNFRGDTPIHVAIREERVEMVAFLAARMRTVNIQNEARETPLNIAMHQGNDEIITILRAHKARLGQPSRNQINVSITDGAERQLRSD